MSFHTPTVFIRKQKVEMQDLLISMQVCRFPIIKNMVPPNQVKKQLQLNFSFCSIKYFILHLKSFLNSLIQDTAKDLPAPQCLARDLSLMSDIYLNFIDRGGVVFVFEVDLKLKKVLCFAYLPRPYTLYLTAVW